jgi:hypothetical protein
MLRHIYTDMTSRQPRSQLYIAPSPPYLSIPFTLPTFYLLGEPAFLARGANAYPLLSLVCYQLFTLCCFTHPETSHRSSYSIYIDDINNISCPTDTVIKWGRATSGLAVDRGGYKMWKCLVCNNFFSLNTVSSC